MYQEQMQLS